ncbi:MAG: PQQ-binding-like beta-propeller repeat protein [Candidatus Dormiibacterota bacterium]
MPTRNVQRVAHGGGALFAVLAIIAGGTASAQVASAQGRSQSANTIPAGFQDWPEHMHDGTHTSVSAETILSASTSYRLHWSANTGGTIAYSSPAVVYNATLGVSLVYVGNQSGDFDAFNAATGALVWQYKTVKIPGLSKEIESSPAVSNNTVYFGDGDYHVYALNATTGALVCKSVSVGGIIASSPVIGDPNGHGPVLYFGDNGVNGDVNVMDGGHLWAMYGVGNTDGTACATKWVFDNFGSPPGNQTGIAGVYSSPAYGTLAGGLPVVVVGSTDNDDSIYEFNANTGAELWRFQTLVGFDSDVGAPPTIAEPGVVGTSGSAAFTDGVVYDTGKDAITYALDLQTGQQIWSFAIKPNIGSGNPSQSGAALLGGFVYIGYGAGLFSLNAATGALNPNWTSGAHIGTTAAASGVISSPAVSGPPGNQVLLVGDLGGNVDVFNLQTGTTDFTYATGGVIFSSAAVSTGQFFIANGGNGNIYAFGSGSAFPSPSVTSVSANHGPAGSSALVTVTGNAFSGSGFTASDVLFNLTDIPASNAYPCLGSSAGCFQVTSPTQIKVDTPTTLGAGTVHISVVTPGGTSAATVADEYTFVAPGAYTALAPYRACDSRPAGGGIAANQCNTGGKGTLGPRGSVNVQITGGAVPAGAQAVVVNLTGLNRSASGTFITAYPTGGSVPGVSNINLAGGGSQANLAIVQLSANGQMSLYNAAGRADVIADVQGYFATPPGSTAGQFHSIPPLRICDSRARTNTECAGSISQPIAGGTWRRVVLSGLPPGAAGGTPSIPTSGAASAVFNLTAVGGTKSTFLSVAAPNSSDACPAKGPAFSNLNPAAGIALPNRVISPLGPHQDVCVYNAAGSINFVIDDNGWFGAAGAPAGALFYSVTPTRICDTRVGSGDECDSETLSANEIQPVRIAGVQVVPAEGGSASPVAMVANLTGVAGTAATVFTLYPSDDATPPRASDLNPSAGQTIANLAVVGLATTGAETGDVSLYNAVGNINAILDVAGWFQ